jgi:hypothetical protein
MRIIPFVDMFSRYNLVKCTYNAINLFLNYTFIYQYLNKWIKVKPKLKIKYFIPNDLIFFYKIKCWAKIKRSFVNYSQIYLIIHMYRRKSIKHWKKFPKDLKKRIKFWIGFKNFIANFLLFLKSNTIQVKSSDFFSSLCININKFKLSLAKRKFKTSKIHVIKETIFS